MNKVIILAATAMFATCLGLGSAEAQVCGSKSYAACVPCCQKTGRDLSTCQFYCKRPASEKKAAAEQDSARRSDRTRR